MQYSHTEAVASRMEFLVIMGAAVKPDGSPSGAMRRRVEGALALGQSSPDPFYVTTGGVGRWGPPEADVMKAELQARGVPASRIATETASDDTLSSVVNCARIIREHGKPDGVFVCSDRYHIARCRWLFRLVGIPTRSANMPSGRSANGILRWSYYYAREIFAMPVDTLILLVHRLTRADV
jgi:vancomycin permeability regulator SanA